MPSGLWHFALSVGVCSLADNNNNNNVCVYDVGCFVDVFASRSGYSGRKPNVPMIAILFKLLSGFVDRVTDLCVIGPGFSPRHVQL